mmetsp:Transcript_55747/g.141385  ORF Transcript_55747/g.141385 Transcript_55747/m.141385 type:complete len:289 (-) Transcript_55747:338-1204(-)
MRLRRKRGPVLDGLGGPERLLIGPDPLDCPHATCLLLLKPFELLSPLLVSPLPDTLHAERALLGILLRVPLFHHLLLLLSMLLPLPFLLGFLLFSLFLLLRLYSFLLALAVHILQQLLLNLLHACLPAGLSLPDNLQMVDLHSFHVLQVLDALDQLLLLILLDQQRALQLDSFVLCCHILDIVFLPGASTIRHFLPRLLHGLAADCRAHPLSAHHDLRDPRVELLGAHSGRRRLIAVLRGPSPSAGARRGDLRMRGAAAGRAVAVGVRVHDERPGFGLHPLRGVEALL